MKSLVRNDSGAVTKYSRLIANLLPKECRFETLEGREHVVVPMVILTEGVHAGSQGPVLYPKDELSKTPAVWNHKPIVVYHPSMNGESISACDPVILNSRKIGVMLNTRFQGGKLKSEAWIEKERANSVDERIMASVEAKEMMELSTGVFIDVENTSGKWKNEDYDGIARNYRPDHLALLPDQVGACSIADGAGFLRNSSLADNEMSFGNIHNALMAALREKFNVGDNGPFVWVADVFTDFTIYEKDGKLWRIGYTANDSGVELSDEAPTQVVRVTEYRTEKGAFVGNTDPSTTPENNMNKKVVIAALIAANVGFVATDEAALMELNETQLQSLTDLQKNLPTANFAMERKDGKLQFVVKSKQPEAAPVAAPAANTPPTTPATAPAPAPAAAAPATNGAEKVVTLESYINDAPKEVQEVLNNSMSIYKEEKTKLVDLIIANKQNVFTKAELEARPLNELKAIARLAAPPVDPNNRLAPNYAGQAPAANSNEEEAMAIPVLTFTRNGEGK